MLLFLANNAVYIAPVLVKQSSKLPLSQPVHTQGLYVRISSIYDFKLLQTDTVLCFINVFVSYLSESVCQPCIFLVRIPLIYSTN